jgi:hypothetical protein
MMRRRLVGYIAVNVSYNDFFGDIAEKDFLDNVNIRLSDASDPSSEILFLKDDPLTVSKHPGNYAPPAEYELKLGEMVWIIRFSEGLGFRDEYNLSMMVPWLTVGIGSIVFLYSLALIIVLLLLRRRAIRLVAVAREKLKESLGLYKKIF